MNMKVRIVKKEPIKHVVINGEFDFSVIMYGKRYIDEICNQESVDEDEKNLCIDKWKEHYGGDIEEYRRKYIERIRLSGGNVYLVSDFSDLEGWEGIEDPSFNCHKVKETYYMMDIPKEQLRELDIDIPPNMVSKTEIKDDGDIPIIDDPVKELTEKEKKDIRKAFEDRGGTRSAGN